MDWIEHEKNTSSGYIKYENVIGADKQMKEQNTGMWQLLILRWNDYSREIERNEDFLYDEGVNIDSELLETV